MDATTMPTKAEGTTTKHLPQVLPTLMPCEIVPCETTTTEQLWKPQTSESTETDGSKKVTAYFRGRRLVGKEIEVPSGYTGFISIPPQVENSRQATDLDDDLDNEDAEDTKATTLPRVETRYTFDKLRILGHEEMPTSDSPHLKAMQEWARISGAVHNA